MILLPGLVGAVRAVVPVLRKPYAYQATASFAAQNSEQGRAGPSALAGAFAITVPAAGQGQSPQFFADLLGSRAILAPIAKGTFTGVELNGAKRTIPQLFELGGLPPEHTTELAIASLASTIRTDANKYTGVVELSVTTPWRSVSLTLVARLIKEVNEFNLRTRQALATDERRFIEARLSEARATMADAEGRLEFFLRSNRQPSSPELSLARDRRQCDVDLNQQVVTALSQSLEDARIRELRNAPLVTMIDPPAVQTTPKSRGRPSCQDGLVVRCSCGSRACSHSRKHPKPARGQGSGDGEVPTFGHANTKRFRENVSLAVPTATPEPNALMRQCMRGPWWKHARDIRSGNL